jgi:Tol biopolymer transport system component
MQLAYGDGRIIVVDADGTHSRQLTHPPAGFGDGFPSWSPDGKRIAFERDNVDPYSIVVDNNLYTMDADGSGLGRWAPGGLDPLWSPSGNQILFVTTTGHDDFWNLIDADRKSRPVQLTLQTRSAAWSPDGRQIVVGMWNGGLDVADASGAGLRKIASGNPDFVAWSPDGRRIAFTDLTASGVSKGIVVVGSYGSGRRLVVRGEATRPAWSPDGTHFAYLAANGVAVVSADGSGHRRLAALTSSSPPAWSPDGAWIALMATHGYTYSVYVLKPDGTALRELRKITRDNAIGGRVSWRPCTP